MERLPVRHPLSRYKEAHRWQPSAYDVRPIPRLSGNIVGEWQYRPMLQFASRGIAGTIYPTGGGRKRVFSLESLGIAPALDAMTPYVSRKRLQVKASHKQPRTFAS